MKISAVVPLGGKKNMLLNFKLSYEVLCRWFWIFASQVRFLIFHLKRCLNFVFLFILQEMRDPNLIVLSLYEWSPSSFPSVLRMLFKLPTYNFHVSICIHSLFNPLDHMRFVFFTLCLNLVIDLLLLFYLFL